VTFNYEIFTYSSRNVLIAA